MRRVLTVLATATLFASSPLVQAGGPFQSELLHLDLPLLSATAGASDAAAPGSARPLSLRASSAEPARAAKPRTRDEVIAELREARARGELDFAAAEVGLLPTPLGGSSMLAGKARDAATAEPALGQR